MTPSANDSTETNATRPAPLNAIQRRILGVLIEKARTTPDAYPLSLNGLVTGCNQKSNRAPLMNLTAEQVEDSITEMREKQLVAEIHGGGRVPKFRHYAYDYLGVKGVEAGVMTELLLRGEQTAGELRTRASRFEPIADLQVMQAILDSLIARDLVVALTPAGRGQLFSHNLYQPHELDALKATVAGRTPAIDAMESSGGSQTLATNTGSSTSSEVQALREELQELRQLVTTLQDRIEAIESK